MTTWPVRIVAATQKALQPLADPERAPAMEAYMKGVAPFLGIGTPARRAAQKTAWAGFTTPSPDELGAAARKLFALDQREYHYAGAELLSTFGTKHCGPEFLTGHVRELITTKSWWDTVDTLRSTAVGPLVAHHPQLRDVMWEWVGLDDRWLVRSAIIHQLGYRKRTDVALLLGLCAQRATDREFFIAKAIGWALRDYSYTDPAAVREFVSAHTELTPLARREALKAITRRDERLRAR